MKVLKIAGLVVLGLIVLFVGIGFFLPHTWNVERTILIKAPMETIHAWTDSPAKWKEWFDFSGMLPDVHVTISGPASGVGAAYAWTMPGSRGRFVIADSDPKAGIHIDEWIEQDEKDPCNARGSILYTAAEDGMTRVTWSDRGLLPPVIGGWFRGMMNAALGDAFEKGLANLKAKVEAGELARILHEAPRLDEPAGRPLRWTPCMA